jgi:hypothetical protein
MREHIGKVEIRYFRSEDSRRRFRVEPPPVEDTGS